MWASRSGPGASAANWVVSRLVRGEPLPFADEPFRARGAKELTRGAEEPTRGAEELTRWVKLLTRWAKFLTRGAKELTRGEKLLSCGGKSFLHARNLPHCSESACHYSRTVPPLRFIRQIFTRHWRWRRNWRGQREIQCSLPSRPIALFAALIRPVAISNRTAVRIPPLFQ